jgi:hypothetical protein
MKITLTKILILEYCVILMTLNICCSYNQKKLVSKEKSDTTDTAKEMEVQFEKIDSLKIYKIDSINNFYVIYGIKKNTRYKIVSKKEQHNNCNPIRPNSYYSFQLSSMLYTIGNIRIAPGAPIGCVIVDTATEVCLEDSIYDLYFSKSLKGLCYIR